jgi:hypothetical protein
MKISNKIKVTLFSVILASLLLVIFLLIPLWNDIKKGSQDLISAKDNIVTLAAQNEGIKIFKNNYQTYKPGLEKIDQLFIDPNDVVGFIEFLESTAYSRQISPKISLQPQTTGQNFMIFTISAKGAFSQMLKLIEKLESGPYFMEIQNFSLQNSQSQNGQQTDIIKEYASKNYSLRQIDSIITIKVYTRQ